eukprot:30799-Pelagococcus_subviridis.AAC.1
MTLTAASATSAVAPSAARRRTTASAASRRSGLHGASSSLSSATTTSSATTSSSSSRRGPGHRAPPRRRRWSEPRSTTTTTTRGGGGRASQQKRSAAADDDDAENADDDDTRIILGELDDLFTLVAARRRGEMLFAEEMSKPDAEIDFVRAAMYVAMHRRPDESRVEDAVEELDELAAELEKLLPPKEERFPLRTLKAISRYMFETLGFEGNQEEFYDPRNSCLDEVLARRKGIPITLSLVYMEVRSYYLLHWSPYDGVGV